MKDPKDSLEYLLTAMMQSEAESIQNKLGAIIQLADIYVPEMSSNPAEEFYEHITNIRAQAVDLRARYGTVSTIDQLTRLKSEFEDLVSFVGLLFVLKSPERIGAFHAAT